MLFSHFFSRLNTRTLNAYKNIAALFALKGVNIAIGFLLVPLTLNYLDTSHYGIWITISAIFNWFSLFDIGLGNGLRNKLAEALAKDDLLKGRIYVSTTYAALAVLFATIFILFFVANYFINWQSILNAPDGMNKELTLLTGIVFFFFCAKFVSQLILTVALAKQDPAISQSFDVVGRIVSLTGIFLLTQFTKGNLVYLGIVLTAVPVVVNIITSVFIFRTRYRDLRPSLSLVRLKELKFILNLGVKFFFIQIAVVVLYQTDIIIITQLYGPEKVTPYSIAFQYFSIATLFFITILTPYWSAFTDAFARNEVEWIKKEVKKLQIIWLILVVLVVAMYLCSDILINLWVGKKVVVEKQLYLVMGAYVIVNAFNAIYSQFMNGVGKVMIQFYVASVLAIIQIPLALYSAKYFGIKGILFPTIILGFGTILLYNYQYRKIINGTAKGLWNR